MIAVLLILCIVLMIGGFFGYNPLRKKWAGIVGVGGSYIILLGIMLLVMLVGSLISAIFGGSTGGSSVVEVILVFVFMLLCVGYMVYVMLTRCTTTAQRVMLPFVACMIGFGFCWRLLASIVLHMPMESGEQETAKFAKNIMDANNNMYYLINEGSDNATWYCEKTGQKVTFYASDVSENGVPYGWYAR